mmetsp:Transcript_38034/g.48016  ORF Transcript_38034/g.48016 Transcript_38034/m.48016 type:complete len:110 (-) Transcript_38034:261-590(-)
MEYQTVKLMRSLLTSAVCLLTNCWKQKKHQEQGHDGYMINKHFFLILSLPLMEVITAKAKSSSCKNHVFQFCHLLSIPVPFSLYCYLSTLVPLSKICCLDHFLQLSKFG